LAVPRPRARGRPPPSRLSPALRRPHRVPLRARGQRDRRVCAERVPQGVRGGEGGGGRWMRRATTTAAGAHTLPPPKSRPPHCNLVLRPPQTARLTAPPVAAG
jgi:hypothetical protein